jgi:hypothetical protein
MLSTRKPTLICLAIACLLTLSTSVAADKWLHVRVEAERGEDVDVNVPLNLVETLLPLITVDEMQKGKLQLDTGEFGGIDLRKLVAALNETPDTDFVTVNGDDESIRVAKEGDFLVVRVEEKRSPDGETVRVRVPLAVVEALVGDSPNELDIVAALRVLSDYEGDALVDIRSESESVRVWIDSSETGR